MWMYRTMQLPANVSRVNVVDIAPGAARVRAVETIGAAEQQYETVLSMAQRTGALAAINGGFFYYQTTPKFGFQSMLKLAGALVSPNLTPRPAVGIRVTGFGFKFATEPAGKNKKMIEPLAGYGDAVGAGPFVIIPTPVPSVGVSQSWQPSPGGFNWVCSGHPRSAVWLASNGHLMLGAFDGKNEDSGMWLDTPQSAYCKGTPPASPVMSLGEFIRTNFPNTVQAMNLDGGGSTTFVVNGSLVNVPSNPGNALRAVIDGIVVLPLSTPAAR
jgi:hypothetical protein